MQANLEHQLSLKCGEVEALQEQNMQLRAQVNALQKCGKAEALQEQNGLLQAQVKALQQQLVSSSMASCLPQGQGLQDQVPSHTPSQQYALPALLGNQPCMQAFLLSQLPWLPAAHHDRGIYDAV